MPASEAARKEMLEKVLLLHFPDAPWPVPADFADMLRLALSTQGASHSVGLMIDLKQRQASVVAEVRGSVMALEELQRLSLQDLEVQGSRVGLMWWSWSAPSGAARSKAVDTPREVETLSETEPSELEAFGEVEAPGDAEAPGTAEPECTQSPLPDRLAEELRALHTACSEQWLHTASELRVRREEGLRHKQELRQLSAELGKRPQPSLAGNDNLKVLEDASASLARQLSESKADWQDSRTQLRVALREAQEAQDECVATRRLVDVSFESRQMEDSKAELQVALREAREAQDECVATRRLVDVSFKSMQWEDNREQLQVALREAQEAQDECAATRMLVGASLESRREEVDVHTVKEEAAATACTAVQTELHRMRRDFAKEFGVLEAATRARLDEAASAIDLEALQGHVADVVGDGVELRRQVLALCEASCPPPPLPPEPSRGRAGLAAGAADCGPQVAALRSRLDRAEAQRWDTLGEVRSRCAEVMESVGFLQGEVDRLTAKVDAGEQNSSRGFALLQQALEAVRMDQRELRRGLGIIQR